MRALTYIVARHSYTLGIFSKYLCECLLIFLFSPLSTTAFNNIDFLKLLRTENDVKRGKERDREKGVCERKQEKYEKFTLKTLNIYDTVLYFSHRIR